VSWFGKINKTSYSHFIHRDIHQDNGELLDVVNKIHNPVPATCANSLGLGNPEESTITEKVDTEDQQQDPIEQEQEDDDKEYPTEDDDVQEEKDIVASITSTTVSSEPSPPTLPPAAVVNDEQQCSNSGEQKCVSSGKSGQWKTCNYNTWLVRECATGLVCFDGQDGKEFIFVLPIFFFQKY
jgi:hypothetical protein